MFRQIYKTFSGFLMGLFIGVGVALLMAPMSGAETRRRLSTNLEQAQTKMYMTLEDYQAKARQLSDISKQVLVEQKSSLKTGSLEAMNVVKTP